MSLCHGCSTYRYEMGHSFQPRPSHKAAITLQQTMDLLGPPIRLAATDSGYVLAWEHWQIREDYIGFSLRGTPMEFLSIDWGRATVSGEFLVLTFDSQMHLSGQGYQSWNDQVGSGQSVQPMFSVVPIIDVSDLLEPLAVHQWGAMSLDPLPQALNHAQRIENGQLEQRGTPTGAGQRTLEMD